MRPKNPRSFSVLQLQHAGQPQLVLHDAVLDAGALRASGRGRAPSRGCRRSASRNRCACRRRWPRGRHRRAPVGGLRVEVDRSIRGSASALSRSVVQGRPPHSFEIASSLAALRPTSSGRGMIASLSLSVTPALLHDGVERPPQVLVQPHAPGDAVHDDADVVDGLLAHAFRLLRALRVRRPRAARGTSTPARGSVPSSSWRQWATSPAGP